MMVIQRNLKNLEAGQQNSSSEDSNGSWHAQPPGKLPTTRSLPVQMQNRQPITRQLAINTLAAMHRRFSLPGPMQPHMRPLAEYRASANKSLDILRQTIQSAVTKEIDQVIKKYLEKFFVPAVSNIRSNLGEESVGEEQVRAVCRSMLDAARALYAAPPRPPPLPSPCDLSDSESSNGADSRFGRPHNSPSYFKRKESDTDSDTCSASRRKRLKQEGGSDASSPRDLHKWSPSRLTRDTLFIMGSHAHKLLGLGQSRGRLYSRHAGLMRYPADSIDKDWISSHNLMNPVGGKTYIMVLEDIEELAASEHYRNNALPLLGELTGFKAPPFMLQKMRAFLARRASSTHPDSPASPMVTGVENDGDKVEIKLEIKSEDNQSNSSITNLVGEFSDHQSQNIDQLQIQEADIDFLNSIDSAEARKAMENVTCGNQDSMSLVSDEFDLGSPMSGGMGCSDSASTKCITVASTTSGLVHSVPVAHLATPARLTALTPHQVRAPPLIRSIPMNSKSTSFGTVLAQGSANFIGVGPRPPAPSNMVATSAQYIGVTPKNFTSGNILHNAIVSRNVVNRTLSIANNGAVTYSINTNIRPIVSQPFNAASKSMAASFESPYKPAETQDTTFDNSISTMRDMIDNTCNSSMMLKKVLTLGSIGGNSRPFLVHTQKVMPSKGVVTTGAPSSQGTASFMSPSTLSASHATLTALLSGANESQHGEKY